MNTVSVLSGWSDGTNPGTIKVAEVDGCRSVLVPGMDEGPTDGADVIGCRVVGSGKEEEVTPLVVVRGIDSSEKSFMLWLLLGWVM